MAAVAEGRGGAAATMDAVATMAALEILDRGGNAVDAAVAAAATLGVTEPFSCGIGGGGFMMVYLAKHPGVVTIDHRETAPMALTATSLQPGNNRAIPIAEIETSGLSVGVPGTVAGWEEALGRFGRMSMAAVLEPAIRAAEAGYVVDSVFAEQVQSNQERFRAFTSTRELFLNPAGEAPPVGSTISNPDLAKTYRLISLRGRKAFYEGALAQALVNAARRPPLNPGTGMRVRPGSITMSDLANYRVIERAPVVSTYRDSTICGMGPPSSGGATIALILNLLEGFQLGSLPGHAALHLYVESMRLAFADRNAYLGDLEHTDVPLAGLLSKNYAAERRKGVAERPQGGQVPAGGPFRFQAHNGSTPGIHTPTTDGEGASTTHVTVTDREGNIVSHTSTIGAIGGSGIVVPEHGFLLNSELNDFDPNPSHPNSPGPGKRPRSSMSPTMVFRRHAPVVALGAAGGPFIIGSVLYPLVQMLDFGLGISEAISLPRVFQHNAEATFAEPEFAKTPEARALEDMGHRFARPPHAAEVTGIAFGPDGRIVAVAEPVRRGGGSAMVQESF